MAVLTAWSCGGDIRRPGRRPQRGDSAFVLQTQSHALYLFICFLRTACSECTVEAWNTGMGEGTAGGCSPGHCPGGAAGAPLVGRWEAGFFWFFPGLLCSFDSWDSGILETSWSILETLRSMLGLCFRIRSFQNYVLIHKVCDFKACIKSSVHSSTW